MLEMQKKCIGQLLLKHRILYGNWCIVWWYGSFCLISHVGSLEKQYGCFMPVINLLLNWGVEQCILRMWKYDVLCS